MKKVFAFVAIAAALTFVACNAAPKTEETTDVATEVVATECCGEQTDSTACCKKADSTACCKDGKKECNKDGKKECTKEKEAAKK